jgi:hypothetical protein
VAKRARTIGLWVALAACHAPPAPDSDQLQPSLAAIVDGNGALVVAAGYTDLTRPSHSTMGLDLRGADGQWASFLPLAPTDRSFRPSGDAWLASAQHGARAYYVSLLATQTSASLPDDVGNGIALSILDAAAPAPTVSAPRRITPDGLAWDEPTVAATRQPGASADTVIVAATPIGPDFQDRVAVLVSRDGGQTFDPGASLFAPSWPGRTYAQPDDTAVRPVLQQDPRPGGECHVYLAFGVYRATALSSSPPIAPPTCVGTSDGCRSIVESESWDCGASWSEPRFIAVDIGNTVGADYRGFSYAVALDGTRFVLFADEDEVNAGMQLKRAQPDRPFHAVTLGDSGAQWDDGDVEVVAMGPSSSGAAVRRWRPTLSASTAVAAIWVEAETVSGVGRVVYSLGDPAAPSVWSPPRPVAGEPARAACDRTLFPEDDYMGVTPLAPFSEPASTFLVAWSRFQPCGSKAPRRIVYATTE